MHILLFVLCMYVYYLPLTTLHNINVLYNVIKCMIGVLDMSVTFTNQLIIQGVGGSSVADLSIYLYIYR